MTDTTPQPSQTDEELRQELARFVYRDLPTNVQTSGMAQALVDDNIQRLDYVMALIQADRERLYGELVTHRQMLSDGEHLHTAIKLHDINKVFNREGADNE